MSTLLLRMDAPMQSWGTASSRFNDRRTETHPTKSAVVGMLAAALGWGRDHDLTRLSDLRFGVRVISEGSMERDYHTAAYHLNRDGRKPQWNGSDTKVTTRWCLMDASSIIGLESDDTKLLFELKHAIENPVYSTYCGRKSCPTSVDLVIGVDFSGMHEAFNSIIRQYKYDLIESEDGPIVIKDKARSFSATDREYEDTRYVRYLNHDGEAVDYMSYFNSKDNVDVPISTSR